MSAPRGSSAARRAAHGVDSHSTALDPSDVFDSLSLASSSPPSHWRGRGLSAVASAAALGVGPGTAAIHSIATAPTLLSGRIGLQNRSVASRRKQVHATEEKDNDLAASFSLPRIRSASRPQARHSPAHAEEDGPSKVSALRLPFLRGVFESSNSTAGGGAAGGEGGQSNTAAGGVGGGAEYDGLDGGSGGIVGGPDAEFEQYERSLGLRTGEDAIEFFARNGNNTPVKFVYAQLRADTPQAAAAAGAAGARDEYRPYDLVIVSRKRVAASAASASYYTISTSGVVHVCPPGPSEVMSLAQWMHESALFNMLRAIRFFKHYLGAKLFRLWRSNVRYRIYCKQRAALSKRLFLARESFAQPLLEVNRLMYDFDAIPLSNVRSGVVYSAEAFVRDQSEARSAAARKFEEKFERLAEQVERVCKGVKDRARQYDHRIANDDLSNSRFAQHLLGGNGRIKSMVSIKRERADRLRQLRHANSEADMLADFIRLVDYIEVEHLVQRSVSNSVQFLHLLLNTNKALFQTTVSFARDGASGAGGSGNANGLLFSPTARDFLAIVQSMHEGCISSVDTVDRVLHHPKFKPFVSPLLVDSPRIARLIQNDRTYRLSAASIRDKIEWDFSTVESTVSFLERHRPVFDFGETWSLETYAARAEHSVESLQRDMLQQTEWNTNIRKVRDLYDAGIFEANTKELKSRLTPITDTALAGMKELLLRLFHAQCLELQETYQGRIKQLEEEAMSLPTFAAHVETFSAIRGEGRALHERSRRIESLHRLMLDYDMATMIPPQDEVAFDDLQTLAHAFEAQLTVTETRIEDKLPSMKQAVYKNIARLNNELEQQRVLLDEGLFVDDKANPRDVLRELDRVRKTLDEIKAQTVTLQGYQVLFEKSDPYHFNALGATQAVYESKRAFWECYAAWLDKARRWNNDDFLSINVEAMERDVAETYATVTNFNREARDSSAPVTLKLKNMVAEYRSIMPMLMQLGNKAVKQQHWRQIFTNLGAGYLPANTEKIRLKNLRKLNIFTHRQLISDICEQAMGEHALQASLSRLQSAWSTHEFTLLPASHSKDALVLGELESVRGKVEENRGEIRAMLESPYVGALQQELQLWDAKLSFLAELLDEWSSCQRSWSTLAPVFSSLDLQRQLPLESKMFAEVDRFWKEAMRRVSNNRNVMHATSQPQILANFLKANKELSRIAKHVDEWVDMKRAQSPQFQSLSNAQLLELLSQPERDPQEFIASSIASGATATVEQEQGSGAGAEVHDGHAAEAARPDLDSGADSNP